MVASDKLRKKSDLDRLNELIDWYERFSPSAGQRIPVACSPTALAKMIGLEPIIKDKQPVSEYEYRGRVVFSTTAIKSGEPNG
jgi:hypothetical protein